MLKQSPILQEKNLNTQKEKVGTINLDTRSKESEFEYEKNQMSEPNSVCIQIGKRSNKLNSSKCSERKTKVTILYDV
jgi:hypothetical protein